jgi:hypothetical protein
MTNCSSIKMPTTPEKCDDIAEISAVVDDAMSRIKYRQMLKYQLDGAPLPQWRVNAMLAIGQILTAEKIEHEWFDFYFEVTDQKGMIPIELENRYVCECQIAGRERPLKVWADSVGGAIEVFEKAIKEVNM